MEVVLGGLPGCFGGFVQMWEGEGGWEWGGCWGGEEEGWWVEVLGVGCWDCVEGDGAFEGEHLVW